ncbi:hypothetical protein CTEN210_04313 [Chaetoceros tenuissimus]|uniref:MYND-type domain-containing protein n=1 Tax=Chaetoceros tenuissimus TaxID=426638 RepID=A0AAD3H259_9STRA|nr:hypothetical protein CTEN210_04313 [Chaetoceros tenuissimus]
MGKRSKRRTGKRSHILAVEHAGAREKEIAPSIEAVESKRNFMISEEDQDEYIEFMLWSLADNKAELTPKRFARIAPRLAMRLIASDISIEDILEKRKEMLKNIEERILLVETREMLKGIKFENVEVRRKFLQQLNESLNKYGNAPSFYAHVYNAFEEVITKWENKGEICLDDSFYFGKSREDLHDIFCRVIEKEVSQQPFSMKKMLVFRKYYFHPTAREESHKLGVYAHKTLVFLLQLYKEMHKCWRCDQLHGKGKESKSLICAECKCATYCSRECQVKHWKEGNCPHKNFCKDISLVWSVFKARTKRVERAVKEGRIFTKPVIVNGIERECCLGPCEQLDYRLCTTGTENNMPFSMDIYYENIAILACGGNHKMFGDETITPLLQEKIRLGYKELLSEFDPSSFTKDEVIAMLCMTEVLKLQNESYDEIGLTRKDNKASIEVLSLDRFITMYICYGPFNLYKQAFGNEVNKFTCEINILDKLRRLGRSNNDH